MKLWTRLLAFAFVVLAAGCAGQPDGSTPPAHGAATPAAAGAAATPPALLTDLGTYSHKITTSSPPAQQYFDQGLRLTYGFNHLAAQRAFPQHAPLAPA